MTQAHKTDHRMTGIVANQMMFMLRREIRRMEQTGRTYPLYIGLCPADGPPYHNCFVGPHQEEMCNVCESVIHGERIGIEEWITESGMRLSVAFGAGAASWGELLSTVRYAVSQ